MSTTKARITIISDTHTNPPNPPLSTSNPYRHPLPKSDILLHAGDITRVGRKHEHEHMLSMLAAADAPLKLVIAGNHDITLDEEYYARIGYLRHRRPGTDFDAYPEDSGGRGRRTGTGTGTEGTEGTEGEGEGEDPWREDTREIKSLYTSPRAREKGIYYLEEGVHTFTLQKPDTDTTGGNGNSNGTKTVKFTVYASPYTPEFCNWAFAYEPDKEDRFNPAPTTTTTTTTATTATPPSQPTNPIPNFPNVDIVLTHGPPLGIFDTVHPAGFRVGCPRLWDGVKRARPRLHVFGHIHEGYAGGRFRWRDLSVDAEGGVDRDRAGAMERIRGDPEEVLEGRGVFYDVSGDSGDAAGKGKGNGVKGRPLVFGEETVFLNASVVDLGYHAKNAPWVVDLDLPVQEGG